MGKPATPGYVTFVPRVLFIENHDSFSWNVIDALPFERREVEIVRPDKANLDGFEVVVMGPGPTDPERAGLVDLVREVARRGLPFLGVCLGHQALGLAFGATLRRSTPAHGKRAVAHFADFRGLQGPMEVMRYHSLSLIDVPSPLRVVASLEDGTVMAIAHESLPMVGVQFHPDSFGTPRGRELLATLLPSPCASGERARVRGRPEHDAAPNPNPEPTETPLSTLATHTNLALLAPAYSGTNTWTLVEDLHPAPTGPLHFASAEGALTRFTGRISAITPVFDLPLEAPTVELDDRGFLDGITTIRQRIAAGDVYQVNLTLRAALTTPSGPALLTWLCRNTVPRFAAWVKSPHLGEFVSASPELLVETDGRHVHVEPMKGTAGPTERAWLEGSEKDRAELAMITDLLRDDLHRLCEPGSVHVTNERRFIELPYVLQAVADVEGTLRAGCSIEEVLRVVHPGGSVTGAPREAALSIISQLETSARGAYCGTLGLEREGASRFALLIRTAEKLETGWRYGVGGGITWDSDPAAELAEVRLKLGALTLRA